MKYCIFAYDLIPVGIVMWNEIQQCYELKFLNEAHLKEKIGKYYCFIDLIKSKLKIGLKLADFLGLL